MTLNYETGDMEIATTDGRTVRVPNGEMPSPRGVSRATFAIRTSTLDVVRGQGDRFSFQIGTAATIVEQPVVYLDQNHWIDLARTQVGSTRISHEKAAVCRRIIDLADRGEILLPISGAHLVETAKTEGRQRADLAHVMLGLSRGWQMRSPLWVRHQELVDMFLVDDQSSASARAPLDVFTLTPWAIWDDAYSPQRPREPSGLPAEVSGLVNRITWTLALFAVLTEDEPTVSARGLAVAAAWAASHQELAQHLRTNRKARSRLRDVSRTRFIADLQQDLARAAVSQHVGQHEFVRWLSYDAETAVGLAPALGRAREVLHRRLSNADDRWEANDLNDQLYLRTAAAYADVVVGEKKTCNYLLKTLGRVAPGAAVFYRLADALDTIEGKSPAPPS